MIVLAPGSTNQRLTVKVVDDSGLPVTGLVASTFPAVSYKLGGNSATGGVALGSTVSVTLSDLSTSSTTFTSGAIKEISGGRYTLDLPNAALTTAGTVELIGEATGKRLICETIQVAYVQSNVKQVADQTASAASGVTFPASIGTSTLTAANVWGYVINGTPASQLLAVAWENTANILTNFDALDTQLTEDFTNLIAAVGNVPGLTYAYVSGANRLFRLGDYTAPDNSGITAAKTAALAAQTAAEAAQAGVEGLVEDGIAVDPNVIASAVWAYGDRRVTDGRIVQSLRTQARTREIIQGNTYGPDARTLAVMASDGGEWPADLDDYEWACAFAPLDLKGNVGTPLEYVATVTVSQPTGDSRSLSINLTAGESLALDAGKYAYAVRGTNGSTVWDVEAGMVEVKSHP